MLKKALLSLLVALLIVTMLAFSSEPVQNRCVQVNAPPLATISRGFMSNCESLNAEQNASNWITEMSNKGYQVKLITSNGVSYCEQHMFVVMERYF